MWFTNRIQDEQKDLLEDAVEETISDPMIKENYHPKIPEPTPSEFYEHKNDYIEVNENTESAYQNEHTEIQIDDLGYKNEQVNKKTRLDIEEQENDVEQEIYELMCEASGQIKLPIGLRRLPLKRLA